MIKIRSRVSDSAVAEAFQLLVQNRCKVSMPKASKRKAGDDTAWHCVVEECSYPHTHVTAAHRCGSCKAFGHGQVECGDKSAVTKLKMKTKKLPKALHCSLPECSYLGTHIVLVTSAALALALVTLNPNVGMTMTMAAARKQLRCQAHHWLA